MIDHLTIEHHPRILSGICRALSIEELSENDKLWSILSELYLATPPDIETNIPEHRGTKEAIAVALNVLATEKRVASIKNLIASNSEIDEVNFLTDSLREIESK